MTMHDDVDLLARAQAEVQRLADQLELTGDVDRRNFVFTSRAAAAATTFGFGAKALAQGASPQGPQQAPTPVPLDNMGAVSWSFQPYPGGTGALLEKTYREKGVAAFARQQFVWGNTPKSAFRLAAWGSAALPTAHEDIAVLHGQI